MRRIPQLDGLRGVAIGLVLLHHYIFQFHAPLPEPLATLFIPIAEAGWSGVDLFFILSGFLIGGILVDARESETYYRTFYIRRVFRILPVYLLLVFTGFLLAGTGGRSSATLAGVPVHLAPWFYYLTFTQNFYFARHAETLWFLQVTWSLAVEEQFYLTLPLLVRTVSKEKLLAVAVGMIVFFCALRSFLYWRGAINPMQSYVLPYCRFDSLFIGVACALLLRTQTLFSRLQKNLWPLVGATAALGILFFSMNHYLWGKNLLLHTAGFTIISLFYAAVMLLVLAHPQTLLARALSYKPLIFLGKVSYCVYLIHGLVLITVDQIVQRFQPASDFEMWLVVFASTAVTLLLAQLSWALFESRMIALGHKFTYDSRPASLSVAAALESHFK